MFSVHIDQQSRRIALTWSVTCPHRTFGREVYEGRSTEPSSTDSSLMTWPGADPLGPHILGPRKRDTNFGALATRCHFAVGLGAVPGHRSSRSSAGWQSTGEAAGSRDRYCCSMAAGM